MARRALAPFLALLLLLLVAAPGAHAALPGVNVASPADVDEAIATGAQEVRLFVHWSTFEPDAPGQLTTHNPTDPVFNVREGTLAAMRRVVLAGRRLTVVVTGAPAWANGGAPETTPPDAGHVAAFADFARRFVRLAADRGAPVTTLEVWNEPDGGEFWKPAPDAAAYTALLRATFGAVKDPAAGDPHVAVFTGPTTGNDHAWIQALYDNGAQGSFDGVAVHADTACLTAAPDAFYRDASGRLGQFTFLGYREVRAVMLAHGDDKPIAMSELGWSSTGGVPGSCTRGTYAGQKPDGVDEATQARYLTAAFACLANDPYVVSADWFTLKDTTGEPLDELDHYGLFGTGGLAKPVLAAFGQVLPSGGPAGPCGDFTAPALRVIAPTPGQRFVDKLDLRAAATDAGVGLARISFFVNDSAGEIRNFTAGLTNDAPVGLAPWQGSGALSLGPHRITVVAIDRNGNRSSQVVPVEKVRSLPATRTPSLRLRPHRVVCRRRACTVSGALSPDAAGAPSIGGKVAVAWELRNRRGRFRKLVGGLRPADRPFTFTARLPRAGRWRVRVAYLGMAPWRPARSRALAFRVR